MARKQYGTTPGGLSLDPRINPTWARIDRLERLMKLAKHLAFEKRFGANLDAAFPGRSRPSSRIKRCRQLAREFGLSYATVRTAFASVWA
jgi:hypothetical protein